MQDPSLAEIIKMLGESKEGLDLIRQMIGGDGSLGPELDDGFSWNVNAPDATAADPSLIEETVLAPPDPEAVLAPIGPEDNTDVFPTLVPRGPDKRRPTLDERIAGGDPYPKGPWRRMFPEAAIEYSYPGSARPDEDRMLQQLLRNQGYGIR